MKISKRIRVGIIGANPDRGWAAQAHIPALTSLADDFEITALSTSRRESADAAGERFGVDGRRDRSASNARLIRRTRNVLRRNMTGPVDLEDRHRDVKPFPYSIYEVTLLPPVVVCAAQSDQDVVRPESAHSVVEGPDRRVIAHSSLGGCAYRGQLAEHGVEALVSFVCGTVGVGHEPLKPARQSGRDDKTLGRAFDQELNEGWNRSRVDGRSSGRDQQSQLWHRCHGNAHPSRPIVPLAAIQKTWPGCQPQPASGACRRS
jgi:hypothetical protein